MKECTLHIPDGDAAARLVRALGSHRYVASRLHLVHAFAFVACEGSQGLDDASSWARRVLESGVIEIGSRDERLWRSSTEAEMASVLATFWGLGAARQKAHSELRNCLDRIGENIATRDLFSPVDEDAIFPLLVDSGWELVPLASFDRERHKGVIAAYGEPILFEAARFDEESAVPALVYQVELPAMGAHELLSSTNERGEFVDPWLPLWIDVPSIYASYILRGVARAAKIDEPYFDDEQDDAEPSSEPATTISF